MRQILLTLIILANCISILYGQKKDEINFSDPYQIDSSDFFLIPRLIGNENTEAYGKGKGYLPWSCYSDINFYNAKTNQTTKLFNGQLAIISPFYSNKYYYEYDKQHHIPANILSKHIVYLARTENINADNGLDSEDPIYLFISAKTGEQLKQITPKGLNVISWTVSKDNKMILVKVQNDKNGNKKFGLGDDELYYRIDLDDDISKIQCYKINL